MHLFIDLDGTLLDVSGKFYHTYIDILKNSNQPVIDPYLYWELKRDKWTEQAIRSLSGASVTEFSEKRKSIIETEEYQHFDVLHTGVKEWLEQAAEQHELTLVTLRNHKDKVFSQLESHSILSYFKRVIVTYGESQPKWEYKVDAIRSEFNGNVPQGSIFIGDTEADIEAGRQTGMLTFGVLNGMRNYHHMKQMSPNYIIPSITTIQLNFS